MATYGRSGVNSFKGENFFSSIRKYINRLFIKKYRGFSGGPMVRNLPAMQGTLVESLV